MKILDHELSSKCESIITDILKQLTFKVNYTYVDGETSYSELVDENYIVSISTHVIDFEEHLLHEMCHLLQFENHYPMIKVRNDICGEDRTVVSDIQDIVLDLEVTQRLKHYEYIAKPNSHKYDCYYPSVRKIKKDFTDLPKNILNNFSTEIFYIMIFDSKQHAEALLKYTDKCCIQIRKNVYHMYDIAKNYMLSGINKDNIPALYSSLIGILSDAEILIDNIK